MAWPGGWWATPVPTARLMLVVCLGGPADGRHEWVEAAPAEMFIPGAGRYAQIPTDLEMGLAVDGRWRTVRSRRVKLYLYAEGFSGRRRGRGL